MSQTIVSSSCPNLILLFLCPQFSEQYHQTSGCLVNESSLFLSPSVSVAFTFLPPLPPLSLLSLSSHFSTSIGHFISPLKYLWSLSTLPHFSLGFHRFLPELFQQLTNQTPYPQSQPSQIHSPLNMLCYINLHLFSYAVSSAERLPFTLLPGTLIL